MARSPRVRDTRNEWIKYKSCSLADEMYHSKQSKQSKSPSKQKKNQMKPELRISNQGWKHKLSEAVVDIFCFVLHSIIEIWIEYVGDR